MPKNKNREAQVAFASARATCNSMGIVLMRITSTEEYRVCPRGGSELLAYYTPDLDDAIATAHAMHAEYKTNAN